MTNKPHGPIGQFLLMLRLLRDDPIVVIVPLLVVIPLGGLIALSTLAMLADYLLSGRP